MDEMVADLIADSATLYAENERLKAALGTISRMQTIPSHRENTITLVAALMIAREAINH